MFLLALKASKISGHLLLTNSQDPLVSNCVFELQGGTWKVQDAVLSCENNIKIKSLETAAITGMGLETPSHQKFLKQNFKTLLEIYFRLPQKKLMMPMPSQEVPAK